MNALAQGMGGLALILGFALLCSRQISLALTWTGAQALTVSVAVAAEQDLVAAVSNAVASGLIVPLLLRQFCIPSRVTRDRSALPGILTAAGALSVLAIEAGPLALPLALLLLGLLLVATRRSVNFQAFGLCSMQQAALLATSTAGMSVPRLALMLSVPALPALAVAGLWLGRSDRAAAR